MKIKEKLDELKKCVARHTELITIYIPAGFGIHQVINQLESEKGTASNIKSNTTRKNVILALNRSIRVLREYKNTTKNGLAIFSGVVSRGSNKLSLQSWVIEPPQKLRNRLYQCDKIFILEPLYELITDRSYYLLIIVENGDCSIGVYLNGYVSLKKRLETMIPSDNKAGGQSSQRFERIRRGLKKAFLKKIAFFINDNYLFDKKLKGIVLGGTFVTIDEFKRSKSINTQLKQKIVCTKSISATGLKGLEELAEKSLEDIANSEIIEKENIVNDFFTKLSKAPEKVVYGIDDVNEMISCGRVSHVITCDLLFKYKSKTVIDNAVRRYQEIVGLGGTVAFLHY